MSNSLYLEAQSGVIGSVLLDAKPLAGEVLHRTKEEDYTGALRTIYCAIRSLFMAGRPIDPVTVLSEIGGEYRDTLMQLMEMTPTAANCMEYIKLTVEQSRLSRLQGLAAELSGCRAVEDAQTVISKMNRLIGERTSTRIVSLDEGLLDFYDRQKKEPNLLPWGYDPMDETLKAEYGDFVIIGGYPSAGKTAFSLQLAWFQSSHKRVGYFSLETKPEKLIDRLVATVCGVDFGRIKGHTMNGTDWADCEIKANTFCGRNLDLIQASGMTVLDIKSNILSKRYDIVYIDYLQLIEPENRRRSDFEQVTQISKDLHRLAAETGVAVCALSQLSRPEKSGAKEKAPGLHSLRQSGQIEQDAENVMLLYKEKPNHRRSRRCLKVAKNKDGEAGGIMFFHFDGSKQRFEVSWDPPELDSEPESEQTVKPPEYEQLDLQSLPDDTPIPF